MWRKMSGTAWPWWIRRPAAWCNASLPTTTRTQWKLPRTATSTSRPGATALFLRSTHSATARFRTRDELPPARDHRRWSQMATARGFMLMAEMDAVAVVDTGARRVLTHLRDQAP